MFLWKIKQALYLFLLLLKNNLHLLKRSLSSNTEEDSDPIMEEEISDQEDLLLEGEDALVAEIGIPGVL